MDGNPSCREDGCGFRKRGRERGRRGHASGRARGEEGKGLVDSARSAAAGSGGRNGKPPARGLDRWIPLVYSILAPVYDRLWARESFRRELVRRLEVRPGMRVLETGVGTGANLPFLCRAVGPRGMVVGVDLSGAMLRKARGKVSSLPAPVKLVRANAASLPFPDEHFDAVLHFGGINFFDDREGALLEMARVAVPGAKLVLCDETIAWRGRLGGRISRLVLEVLPRLKPPLGILPDSLEVVRVDFTPRGFFYLVELRKGGRKGDFTPRGAGSS